MEKANIQIIPVSIFFALMIKNCEKQKPEFSAIVQLCLVFYFCTNTFAGIAAQITLNRGPIKMKFICYTMLDHV